MNRLPRMLVPAALIATGLWLSGCSSFDTTKFDPTDLLDKMLAEQKKPLPGERKELFPGGTPGVQQGVPPDLVKGYQPPPEPPPEDQPPEPAKPKAKGKAKAKAKASGTAATAPPPSAQPN